MLASTFALIFAFFPLVFVVSIHSFRMYDQEFPHILCLFDTFAFLWTWIVRHLILWRMVSTWSAISIEPRMWFSIFRVFCKNEKVFTCSVIFYLAENEVSILCIFCKNDKVSTCSVILDLVENEVSVLWIFLLWFRHAQGSRDSPFSPLFFDILPLCSWRFTSRGATFSMLLRFTRRRRSNGWGFPWKLNIV